MPSFTTAPAGAAVGAPPNASPRLFALLGAFAFFGFVGPLVTAYLDEIARRGVAPGELVELGHTLVDLPATTYLGRCLTRPVFLTRGALDAFSTDLIRLHGALTIRDVTRPIAFDVTVSALADDAVRVRAQEGRVA